MSVTKADVETVTTLIWDLENERNDALARVKALEAEVAALRAVGHPRVSGWIDRERYSFRDDGTVLRVAEIGGDDVEAWATYVFASHSKYAWETADGKTLAEAKANLDAWGAAPAKATARYTVRAAADRLFDVYRDESVFVPDLLRDDAERVAKALNAQQEQK